MRAVFLKGRAVRNQSEPFARIEEKLRAVLLGFLYGAAVPGTVAPLEKISTKSN
jgi:hypothetical protein